MRSKTIDIGWWVVFTIITIIAVAALLVSAGALLNIADAGSPRNPRVLSASAKTFGLGARPWICILLGTIPLLMLAAAVLGVIIRREAERESSDGS